MKKLMVAILLAVVFAGCSTTAVKHDMPVVIEKPSEPFVPQFAAVKKEWNGYVIEEISVAAMYEGRIRHVSEEITQARLMAEFNLASKVFNFISGYLEMSSKNMTQDGQVKLRRVLESGIRKYAAVHMTGVEELDKAYSKDFCTVVMGINKEDLKTACDLTIKTIKSELGDERDRKTLELEHQAAMQKLDRLIQSGGKLSENTEESP